MEACALPRATSAWGSPKDAESAASASVGVTEEDYPPKPLSPQAEKAPEPLVLSEEVPSAGSQSCVGACPKPLRALGTAGTTNPQVWRLLHTSSCLLHCC